MLTLLASLVVGLGLLALAADQFVVGAGRLSRALGVAPVVVGAVVVGFGTSLPELLVSALGAADGEVGAAYGNVLGSNIANLTLILGAGAIIRVLAVDSRIIARELPLAVAAMAAAGLAAAFGGGRLAGAVLLLLGVCSVVITLRSSMASPADVLGEEADELLDVAHHGRRGPELLRTLLGLIGTIAGAQLLLFGALGLATLVGLSGGAVGATLVAVGTSLPELVTTIQAARRDEADLVLGNLLGSNVFNALLVAGTTFAISPIRLDVGGPLLAASALSVAVGVLVALLMRTGRSVTRLEGVLLLAVYVASVPVLLATG